MNKKDNITLIYNPFIYLAGEKALLLGILILLISSYLSGLTGTHYYRLTNISFAKDLDMPYYFLEHFAYWVIMSTCLFILGIIFSKSRIRWIDVYGTTAVSLYPLIFIPLIRLIPTFSSFVINSVYMYILTGVHILLAGWCIWLIYNAFEISCNLKGPKLILSYLGGLIITEILIKIIIYYVSN